MGLPFALSLLGWPIGLLLLTMAFTSTLWASFLLSKLCRWNGKHYIRYRDLAEVIPQAEVPQEHLSRYSSNSVV